MYVKIVFKRIDEIVVGDIVRSAPREYQTIKDWSEVMGVEVDEEYPVTMLRIFRPRTNDGFVDISQIGRVNLRPVQLSSFDLVEVQVSAMDWMEH